MLTVADLLTLIEEQKTKTLRQLSKEIEIPKERLHTILEYLNRHDLVKYDAKTGTVTLPAWLQDVNKEMEKSSPATGEIILPRYREIQIQDIVVGNYTARDLELKVRLKAKLKEIAICEVT
jgi:hypothetical protein